MASLTLVFFDRDFEKVETPCIICMPRSLVMVSLGCLFLGAELFSLFATHRVWVISGVMTLAMSGFLFAIFCAWERKKTILAALQMVYVAVITVHFYSWW